MPVRKDKYDCVEVLRLLETSDMNLGQLATHLNCYPPTFYNWISLQDSTFKAEIQRYKFRNGERGTGRWDVEASEVLALLEAKNFSFSELAAYYGIHRSTLGHWVTRQTAETRAALQKFHRKPGKKTSAKKIQQTAPNNILQLPTAQNFTLPMGLVR